METPQNPGWYDDPEDAENLRYFDGIVWTSNTVPRRVERQVPATPVGGPAAPAPASHPGSSGWGHPPANPNDPWAAHRGRQVSGPVTGDGVPLAGYGQRVLAYIVDWILTWLLIAIAGAYWLIPMSQELGDQMAAALESGDTQWTASPEFTETVMQYAVPLTLVSVVVVLAYNAFFLTRFAATPGKMMVGISVRKVARPGRIGVGDALRRYVLQSATNIAGLLPLIGIAALGVQVADLVWPLGDTRRQALHDKIADTVVVKGKQPRA